MVRIHQGASPKTKSQHRKVIRVPSQVTQLVNRARKALEEIHSRVQLQEWLDCTDSQMQAVERALLIRRTISRDFLCCDAESTTLHELIADEQNSNNLDQLDWDLSAETISRMPT